MNNETLIELENARKTIQQLEAVNAALVQELAGKTVVKLERRPQK
jgi:hypothetical protein